jgi:hypothetical protein
VRRVVLLCAAIAFCNAFVFSIVTPYGQVPDEQSHLGYADYVRVTGKPPTGAAGLRNVADANALAFTLSDVPGIVANPLGRVPARPEVDRELEAGLEDPGLRPSQGGPTAAINNPPGYYYLAAGAALAAPGDYLDDLQAMRLVSSLLWALTAACAAAFLLVLLPAAPWAAAAGGMVVALQPQAAFIAGGVNNDAALYATGAALLLGVARAFRFGLTPRTGAFIGAALALGALSKLTLLALAPGVGVGLLVLVARAWRHERRAALVGGVLAVGLPLLALVLWFVVADAVDRAVVAGGDPSDDTVAGRTTTFNERLSYVWRSFLPALWFMDSGLGGWRVYDPYFFQLVGKFGWLDYTFPGWVYALAVGVAAVVLAAVAAELARCRAALRRRLPELLTYALMLAGLCFVVGMIGASSLKLFGLQFEQGRYLFPLLGLYGALVTLAVRRLGRPAGAVFVSLALLHALSAHLMTVGRYYG